MKFFPKGVKFFPKGVKFFPKGVKFFPKGVKFFPKEWNFFHWIYVYLPLFTANSAIWQLKRGGKFKRTIQLQIKLVFFAIKQFDLPFLVSKNVFGLMKIRPTPPANLHSTKNVFLNKARKIKRVQSRETARLIV